MAKPFLDCEWHTVWFRHRGASGHVTEVALKCDGSTSSAVSGSGRHIGREVWRGRDERRLKKLLKDTETGRRTRAEKREKRARNVRRRDKRKGEGVVRKIWPQGEGNSLKPSSQL